MLALTYIGYCSVRIPVSSIKTDIEYVQGRRAIEAMHGAEHDGVPVRFETKLTENLSKTKFRKRRRACKSSSA